MVEVRYLGHSAVLLTDGKTRIVIDPFLTGNPMAALGVGEGGWLKWVPAWHSSSFPDGTYGGMPMGVVVELGGKRIYHAGDTALFSDMRLIGEMGLDLALLPIGDHFTMGPEDALKALELLRPKKVVPIHYNTFPPIRQDGEAFAQRAREKGVEGHALKPGEVLRLD